MFLHSTFFNSPFSIPPSILNDRRQDRHNLDRFLNYGEKFAGIERIFDGLRSPPSQFNILNERLIFSP